MSSASLATAPDLPAPAAVRVDIRDHVALAHYVIRRWGYDRHVRRGALEYDDILVAALCGLARAAESWDPKLGAYTTHAVVWARQQIRREIQNMGSTIRVPVHRQDERRRRGERVWPVVRSCSAPLSRDPESSATLEDRLVDPDAPLPDAELERQDAKRELAGLYAKARLTRQERRVLELRSAEVCLLEIGLEFGVSRERIRQIETKALLKMRRVAGCPEARGGFGHVLRRGVAA